MSDVEDEGRPTPVRVKEVGTTTVACPMLSSTNYTVWALRMKIGDVDSPKVLWESIKARYVGADRVKEARLQTLNSEFDRLKMHETETETIDVFAGKLAGIASKSASLGETTDESKLVKKLLKVVLRKFIHLVASLEQVLDLKTVGFEDVVGRLKAYEERIRGDEGGDEQQRLMLTRVSGGGGSFNGGRYGVGSSNGAGGQRLLFTRSNGGSGGGAGAGSSRDGRNTGGGGVSFGGFSGSGDWLKREAKGKWGRHNNRCEVINKDGSSGSGSSKAQSFNKLKSNKPNNQPNCISEKQETIGSNQVQGNAELDRNRRYL